MYWYNKNDMHDALTFSLLVLSSEILGTWISKINTSFEANITQRTNLSRQNSHRLPHHPLLQIHMPDLQYPFLQSLLILHWLDTVVRHPSARKNAKLKVKLTLGLRNMTNMAETSSLRIDWSLRCKPLVST